MSLVSFSDNFGQISLNHPNYLLTCSIVNIFSLKITFLKINIPQYLLYKIFSSYHKKKKIFGEKKQFWKEKLIEG